MHLTDSTDLNFILPRGTCTSGSFVMRIGFPSRPDSALWLDTPSKTEPDVRDN